MPRPTRWSNLICRFYEIDSSCFGLHLSNTNKQMSLVQINRLCVLNNVWGAKFKARIFWACAFANFAMRTLQLRETHTFRSVGSVKTGCERAGYFHTSWVWSSQRDTTVKMAGTLAFDLLASIQPHQNLGHSCFLCVYFHGTIIRGGKAHCCILTNPHREPKHSWVLCVGTTRFCQARHCFYPLPVCWPCPAIQSAKPCFSAPIWMHSYSLTLLGVGSSSIVPITPPPTYPTGPWVNPRVHSALLPLCHQQCWGLVILDSIQLWSECTKQK